MADAINDLIARIEDTLARERAFLADAAHELRTPLAALEAQAHVVVHAQSAEERAAAAEDITARWRGLRRCCAVLDREAMVSLLDNLLDNAVRYVPEGGRVQVCLRAANDAIVLHVLDDGPGVRPADRERIFDRFYRGAGKDETGSGLGLAIAKQVAVLHGGEIRLTEGIGSGAGFELRLRAAEVESDDEEGSRALNVRAY